MVYLLYSFYIIQTWVRTTLSTFPTKESPIIGAVTTPGMSGARNIFFVKGPRVRFVLVTSNLNTRFQRFVTLKIVGNLNLAFFLTKGLPQWCTIIAVAANSTRTSFNRGNVVSRSVWTEGDRKRQTAAVAEH